jgi:N utilization substance protein B
VARRSEQRRRAVFALYQHDLTGRSLDETLPRDAAPFTRALAEAAIGRQSELDALIAHHAEGWALERIAPLERSILRVGLLEMLHPGDVPAEQPIPPEGAIDEAIETAKAYCGSEAPGFVNGILAAVLRAHQAEAGAAGREASA